jgi:hypothetical protein
MPLAEHQLLLLVVVMVLLLLLLTLGYMRPFVFFVSALANRPAVGDT